MKILRGSSKQGVFQVLSFFGICGVMCGAAIGILVSSGWLLLLADEGRQKTFLIPLLILLAAAYFIYRKRRKMHTEHQLSIHYKLINIFLYLAMSFLLSALLMLYVFIPWWLPGYKGGPLLP